MSIAYTMKKVESKETYTKQFIDQVNSDTNATTKNRKNENLTVNYLSTDGIFSVVNGYSTEHIRHDSNISNISYVTVVADKHNHPVFAYQHDKDGSNEKCVSINWFDENLSRWKVKTFAGASPLLVTDEHRSTLLDYAEVICYFVQSNSLKFNTLSKEFNDITTSTTLNKEEVLVKVGITKNHRIQLETTRPVTEISYSALLDFKGLPILDKNRNPLWVGHHHPI